jgi:branched-subunit amino acid aminotransferase/4-amino-4-deoxychorismate lyase
LAGITRATVLELAREQRIPSEEVELFPRDLYDADEAFITSSVREVVPVIKVDGLPVGAGLPGPLTRRLQAAYRKLTTAVAR